MPMVAHQGVEGGGVAAGIWRKMMEGASAGAVSLQLAEQVGLHDGDEREQAEAEAERGRDDGGERAGSAEAGEDERACGRARGRTARRARRRTSIGGADEDQVGDGRADQQAEHDDRPGDPAMATATSRSAAMMAAMRSVHGVRWGASPLSRRNRAAGGVARARPSGGAANMAAASKVSTKAFRRASG